jgi:hypothetical protein
MDTFRLAKDVKPSLDNYATYAVEITTINKLQRRIKYILRPSKLTSKALGSTVSRRLWKL